MSASAHAIPLAADLCLTISWFDTSTSKFGTEERITWRTFSDVIEQRREGEKDGCNFIPATFAREPNGRVRRLKEKLLTRTAIAMDLETNKQTGEIPPSVTEAAERIRGHELAAVVYSSHNHTTAAPQYRIVLPLSEPIAPTLPAVDVAARLLGLVGVLDKSKRGASSLFYLPSSEPGHLEQHEMVLLNGEAIEAGWMRDEAGAILAAREAEQARLNAEAMEAAVKRREAAAAQGYDPDSSIIEKVRDRLDLAGELVMRGYKASSKNGRFLYPESETGVPGVYLLTGRDGVQRAYSHHAGDPAV